MLKALLAAPEDDESYSDEDREAVREAWDDIRAGRVTTLADAKRELGL